MANASSFTLPTQVMAMYHPFVGPTDPTDKRTGLPVRGMPMFIDIRTREVIVIDPWMLKDAGIIHSAFGIILGPKGHGKSTLLKVWGNRMCLLPAGYDMPRLEINDYKPEDKGSEYEKFTKHMNSKVFEIAKMQFNPLDARLFTAPGEPVNVLGIMRVIEILIEHTNIGHEPILGDNAEAMAVAVAMMLRRRPELWSLAVLFDGLRSITDKDIDDYNTSLRSQLARQIKARLDTIATSATRQILTTQAATIGSNPINLDYDAIKRAGMYVSTLVGRVIHGSYGSMFGMKHSLYDILTQRVATKDWRGVPRLGEELMRKLDTEVKIVAIELNRMDLLPHMILDDEQHRSMGKIEYARGQSFFSEIARGTHTNSMSATHRYSSIRRGGVGSELYDLANTIIDNIGLTFYGRHEATDPGIDELIARHDLSEVDREMIIGMPQYTFGIKLGQEHKVRYGRLFVLPSEVSFLGTNSANDRMVNRPDVLYPEQLLRFAEQNGIVYLGVDD